MHRQVGGAGAGAGSVEIKVLCIKTCNPCNQDFVQGLARWHIVTSCTLQFRKVEEFGYMSYYLYECPFLIYFFFAEVIKKNNLSNSDQEKLTKIIRENEHTRTQTNTNAHERTYTHTYTHTHTHTHTHTYTHTHTHTHTHTYTHTCPGMLSSTY